MNVLCHAQCKLKKTSRTWWEVCAQCIATWQQAQRACFLSYLKKLDSSIFPVLLAIPCKLPNIFFNVTLFGTVWMGVRCAFHTLVVMASHFVSCYRLECAGKAVYWARGRVGGLTWVCLRRRWLHGVACLLALFCTDPRFRSTLPVLGSANVVSVDFLPWLMNVSANHLILLPSANWCLDSLRSTAALGHEVCWSMLSVVHLLFIVWFMRAQSWAKA